MKTLVCIILSTTAFTVFTYIKIMASLEAFQVALTRIDEATSNIAEDLRGLKDQITGQGLPSDVEEEILAQLEAKAVALESIAGETPEDEEEPTEPVDEE